MRFNFSSLMIQPKSYCVIFNQSKKLRQLFTLDPKSWSINRWKSRRRFTCAARAAESRWWRCISTKIFWNFNQPMSIEAALHLCSCSARSRISLMALGRSAGSAQRCAAPSGRLSTTHSASSPRPAMKTKTRLVLASSARAICGRVVSERKSEREKKTEGERRKKKEETQEENIRRKHKKKT